MSDACLTVNKIRAHQSGREQPLRTCPACSSGFLRITRLFRPKPFSQLQTSSDAFKTPLNAIQPGTIPCLPPPLWERSAAERCLIYAENVSLFPRLQLSSAHAETVPPGPLQIGLIMSNCAISDRSYRVSSFTSGRI